MTGLIQEFYPGSKTPRREAVVVVDEAPQLAWDAKPILRTIRGREVEFFTIGSLAQALNRAVVSIRLWEKKGYIPKAPYRLPDHKGGKGDRLYTRAIIEATVKAFEERDLLAPRTRIRWEGDHKDLTIHLTEKWDYLVENQKY